MKAKDPRIYDLTKVDEISEKTATILFNIGIETPEDLASAKSNDIFERWKKFKAENPKELAYQITEKELFKLIENAKKEDYKYSLAKIRYNSLIERTFSESLKLLLFEKIVLEKKYDFDVSNINFDIKEKSLKRFKESYLDMTEVRDNNKIINDWEKNNKGKIKAMKKSYQEYFIKNLPYDDFKEKYHKDTEERECKYCKIKESEIKDLIDKEKIHTKRIYSRGKSLEIDRTNPNGKYIIGNIELCCYWCNNAKTDEFNEKEFTRIGSAIKSIWDGRLAT